MRENSRQTAQIKDVVRIQLPCTDAGMGQEAMKLNTLLQIWFIAEYL